MTSSPYTSGDMSAWMMSAASRSRSLGRNAPARANERAIRPWPSLPLASQFIEERRRVGVRARRADEDAVDRRGPRVHLGGDSDKARQLALRVWIGEQRSNVRAICQRSCLIVTDDRDVEEGLEDPALGREQSVHRGRRDVRDGADGLDRRGPVAAFEEQSPGGVDDRGPSQAGPGLAAFAVDGSCPWSWLATS